MRLVPGTRLGPYEIVRTLGAGGMGEVYEARDTRLGRTVALKVLPAGAAADADRRLRFQQEARLISTLNHPHICTLHDVGREGDTDFLVMEYVQGTPLSRPYPVQAAVEYATQIADALRAAHHKGIIHRDLKPANIMLTPDGQVKVLDFGLAKHLAASSADDSEAATTIRQSGERSLTGEGVTVGTAAYMSPEQVEAKPLDARSDIFSFGTVLYELLTGQRAFHGDSAISTMSAILRDTPARVSRVRPDVPEALEAILDRCLQKNSGLRYQTADDLHSALLEVQRALVGRSTGFRAAFQPRIIVPALLVLATATAAAVWFSVTTYRANWARRELLPEISHLVDQGQYVQAFERAERAEQLIPGDKVLADLWPRLSTTVAVTTDPPGAAVVMKEYGALDAPWQAVGVTPLERLRIPRGYFRWRLSLAGYEDLETGGPTGTGDVSFRLVPVHSSESGMTCLSETRFALDLYGFSGLGPWPMEPFCIDRFEVTNRQFKQFVDAGGYRRRELWQEPFVEGGRALTWEDAMKRFVDSSGRPGPATWEAGSFREGQDDLPVGGVSWYEAAAYAEYVGKSLPTVYHWYQASGTNPAMVSLSNFGGKGAARGGNYQGVSQRGVYDLAGNHREWASTETQGRRYALGGAWNDPPYFLAESETRDPFDRAAENGFRCVTYQGGKKPPARYAGALDKSFRDYAKEKPASEEAFRIFASFYPRDTGPLEARVESEEPTTDNWRKLKVSYAAGYGDERLAAYLFLPGNAVPPYQVVVFFPGSGALQVKTLPLLHMEAIDFIIRSGRAVLHPIYKGTYDRSAGLAVGAHTRETVTWWLSEVRRSVDYLESRSDIDAARVGYVGLSWGARLGSMMLAMEPRLKAAVLLSGGYNLVRRSPEIDDFNYTPRVKAPVLMINGRYDFVFPLATSSEPMFRGLGTPDGQKKQVTVDAGHNVWSGSPRSVMTSETLDWLDRYLGPVKLK
jgi:eukaryotic-like serine/threonine-protein kinase